ncbi:PaaI family thioesterase [Sphingomonas japonica]|uniref:Uncharacterized protein (TIGR00369 family) n=2 Tax=Sphingomonas japonica TaxID=511662 RepID=A0ABX0U0N2_9SPHN|nr:PaaI family thioesterase [Sphingomonas japonica]NIJ24105.1 uncharacterized protein (TIGR00369 family) [Sphingomonas japonica]
MVDSTRFNATLGPIAVRIDDGIARVRMDPTRRHSNLRDHVHGGALLGFMDVAVFAAARAFGIAAGGSSTIDLSAQFVAGADAARPIEARIELLRETGRLFFVRGLIAQDTGSEWTTCASFTCTARKPSAAR